MEKTSVHKHRAASYRAPALEKGLDVLESIATSSEPLSLTAIAGRLGRTKQELFRVVVHLFERGYLIRDRAGRYRISTKLFELGSRHASLQSLVERAMPHMEQLARQLGESCHLNVVVQNRMLVVARADCDADIALAVRVGASFEMHIRNTGKVALAYLPAERREAYWRHARQSPQNVKRWERELASIRREGLLEADSPVTVGVRDCATAVVGVGGQLIGVLCVSHIVRVGEPSRRADIPQAVVACAKDVSREFGPPGHDLAGASSCDLSESTDTPLENRRLRPPHQGEP